MRRSTSVPAALLAGALAASVPALAAPAPAGAAAPVAADPAAAVVAAPAPVRGETRDPLRWPYARTSIWNTPIGSGARYATAGIGARNFGIDEDWFVVTRKTDPLVPTYQRGNWGEGRCTGTTPQQQAPWHAEARRRQNIPRNLVIADAITHGGVFSTPNNASTFLQPDGKTLVSYSGTARCRRGGPLYGDWFGETSLLGDGIDGGHGGSGMSSIGGSIRTGELLGSAPIRHALKVDLWGSYLYYDQATGGKRWPARLADGGAPDQYKGGNKALRMGALLAVPPAATARSLGIRTAAGRKLFAAMQDYGAYVVDDSGWDFTYLTVERTANLDYRKRTGHAIEADPALQADFGRLIKAVQVVDNNGPKSIGGPGARRAPLAPPLRAAGSPAPRAAPATTAAVTAPTATATATAGATASARQGATATAAAPAAGTVVAPAATAASTIPAGLAAARTPPQLDGSTLWVLVAAAAAALTGGGWLGRRMLASPAPSRRPNRHHF